MADPLPTHPPDAGTSTTPLPATFWSGIILLGLLLVLRIWKRASRRSRRQSHRYFPHDR